MDGTAIGDQLKAARKLRGVKNTRVLAGMVNKPRFGEKVIGQIERNERAAQPHEIEWFAQALDLPETFFTQPPAGDQTETQLDRIERRLDAIEAQLVSGQDLLDRLDRLEKVIRVQVDDATQRLEESVSEARSILRAASRGPRTAASKREPKRIPAA